ncbi:Hsp70 family protein [Acetobacter sp. DsW_063]|uniref:Hsp70 family protein n=1 Tax=Acetobacter sp. DsW_063 TaxID=1514894 RepID=UPI000A38A756|nr:molecular chaperone HscC [Acetobacter sp. DsW_063]OUJ14511.1 2-alkenal reductase [Acetobacter sp. DsW_063]
MIIGIDLGTTNSLASVWKDGRPVLVPQAHGGHLTPSVVSVDRNGEVLVGQTARERLTTHPDRTAAAFKRIMGTARTVALGGQTFRPEELSSFVLRSLKADAEAFLGERVTEAVITVPAYFNDTQRNATRAAGRLAGLKVERLLNEPTAAALAYGLQEQEEDGSILVFDLGGGTFDVSVLELFDGVMEVRATAGDNFLGGEDFDDALIGWFRGETGWRADPLSAAGIVEIARLRAAVEQARHRLNTESSVEIVLRSGAENFDATLTANEFAVITAPLLEQLRRPVERALRDSRIQPRELSRVVLVGGATRMKLVRSLAATMFGQFPLQQINPDEVVACGAAVQAGLKMRDAALDDVVLTDVAPYTLGIEVSETGASGSAAGRLLPIIERNTVVPVSRVQRVTPTKDYQGGVEVRVFQGESRLVKDNILLGKLQMMLQPRPAAQQAIDVRFTYDINGILEVTAQDVETQSIERLVIEENPGLLSQEEIEERLEALAEIKIHPREEVPTRLLLARAERLYEETLGATRASLATEIGLFERALTAQDRQSINDAADRLKAALESLAATSL